MSLAPREQRILAGIENELGETDPALTAAFARARLRSSTRQRFPLSARHMWLLIVALLAQIVLAPVALQPPAGPMGPRCGCDRTAGPMTSRTRCRG